MLFLTAHPPLGSTPLHRKPFYSVTFYTMTFRINGLLRAASFAWVDSTYAPALRDYNMQLTLICVFNTESSKWQIKVLMESNILTGTFQYIYTTHVCLFVFNGTSAPKGLFSARQVLERIPGSKKL